MSDLHWLSMSCDGNRFTKRIMTCIKPTCPAVRSDPPKTVRTCIILGPCEGLNTPDMAVQLSDYMYIHTLRGMYADPGTTRGLVVHNLQGVIVPNLLGLVRSLYHCESWCTPVSGNETPLWGARDEMSTNPGWGPRAKLRSIYDDSADDDVQYDVRYDILSDF